MISMSVSLRGLYSFTCILLLILIVSMGDPLTNILWIISVIMSGGSFYLRSEYECTVSEFGRSFDQCFGNDAYNN